MEAVQFLYSTPMRGPTSIGRQIDDALHHECKSPLRWGNAEVQHAHSLATAHPTRAPEIAKNIIRLRLDGKFDKGFKHL